MNWDGHGAVLRCDKADYVDMLFIRCTEEEVYSSLLVSIVRGNLSLADDAFVTSSPAYVAFAHLYDILHFLASFN